MTLTARRSEALRLFQEGRYPESADLWEALAAESPLAADWLSAVTSSLMAGRADAARRLFPEALAKIEALRRPGPGALTPAVFLSYCAHAAVEGGCPKIAMDMLARLAALYSRLTTSDDHLLLTRGFVGLGALCELLAKAHLAAANDPAWPAIFQKLESGMDEEGRARVRALRLVMLGG